MERTGPSYVLITPAKNEAALIEHTLRSVTRQRLQPLRWVVVDDGSTDATASIVAAYAAAFPWIELLQMPRSDGYAFSSKARSVNAGFARLRAMEFEFVASLDADISFDEDYFAFILEQFSRDPKLGVAGTPMTEAGYDAVNDDLFNEADVFGACQVFRRECYEQVGGYVAIKEGGIDSIALRSARMHGWKTRSFLEKRFFHHRPMGQRHVNTLVARFRHGRKDYFLGNHPLWEMFRVGWQCSRPPYIIGGFALMAGYAWAALTRTHRPVPPELMRFHRREQMERLKGMALGVFKPRAVNKGASIR
jgi:glycosyltransferase involved in cell wall biosynthesis